MSQQATVSYLGINAALEAGRDRARQLGRSVLVSVTRRVPAPASLTALYGAATAMKLPRAYWARPADEFFAVGMGEGVAVRAAGHQRFQGARHAHRELLESALVDAPEVPGAGPLFFGGGRFDADSVRAPEWVGFDPVLFIAPRLTMVSTPDASFSTVNVLVGPTANPAILEAALGEDLARWHATAREPMPAARADVPSAPGNAWLLAVEEALEAISAGSVAKVVLARSQRMRFDTPPDQGAVLDRLVNAHPTCLVYAFGTGAASFMGATPEVLVRQREGEVGVTCLAGTVRRGATIAEDQELARDLLDRIKERREHAMVVDAVREALTGLCTNLAWDKRPHIAVLPTLQHMATSFQARRPAGAHVLDLVARLHPTPAVGGAPRDAAMELIRRLEGMDRGWYAGPIGMLDRAGEGEFGIALRSALVRDREALLFAGAGIVAGSAPAQELAETELKLRPMLNALGGAS